MISETHRLVGRNARAGALRFANVFSEFGKRLRPASGGDLGIWRGARPFRPLLCLVFLASALRSVLPAETGHDPTRLSPAAQFERGNQAYEKGLYQEAVAAYEEMMREGVVSPAAYLNLGNAHFKANQFGSAIAAYRMGLKLAPRDPALQFNLKFTREKVATGQPETRSWLERTLTRLTLNEWTAVGMVFYWVWFGLLAVREWRLDWRRYLQGYTAVAGLAMALLVGCLIGAARYWNTDDEGVIVAHEAVVRYGPLEVSQEHFKLRNGQEIQVMGREVKEGAWLNVREPSGREGWVHEEAVARLALGSIP